MKAEEFVRLAFTAIITGLLAFTAGAVYTYIQLPPPQPPEPFIIIDVWTPWPLLIAIAISIIIALLAPLIERHTEPKGHLTSEITYHPKFAQTGPRPHDKGRERP